MKVNPTTALYVLLATLLLSCASSQPGTPGASTGGDSLTVTDPRGLPQDGPPILLSMQPPDYPEMARDAGTEGTVIVRVLVGVDGLVRDAEVVEGVLGLDEAALETARTGRFRPAHENGQPVEVWMILPIEFKLP